MPIIQQLAQLHQLAPDICQRDGDSFIIGTRHIWEYNGTLLVQVGKGIPPLTNKAALDLLQGALQRAIEARGSMEFSIISLGVKTDKQCRLSHYFDDQRYDYHMISNTFVEALLTALLAALESEQ